MQTFLGIPRAFTAWLKFFGPRFGMAILTIFLAISTPSCATVPVPAYVYHEGNTCNVDGSEHGHPDCLPPSGFYCSRSEVAPEQVAQSVPDPQYMAQGFSLFPSKDALGPAQPICPPNATRLVQEDELRNVKEGVAAIAKQIGSATANCENLIEQITHYPDGTFKRWYLEDPSKLGVVLDACAAELDAIPEIPTFDDPWLAMAAKDAFERGYGAGVDEVANRIFIIELAIDTIEMIVFPELVVAEMAMTKAIRASMASLRRVPIFIPGFADGFGAVVVFTPRAMKAMAKTAANAVTRGSSRVLARALKKVGKFRLVGEFCHHIVAHGDARAKAALAILDKFGIGVDEAVNGVFLPGFKSSPNPLGKVVHGNVHTDAYYKAVNKMLGKATSPEHARQILKLIAENLEKGIVPQ
jgi:hypothetical protein